MSDVADRYRFPNVITTLGMCTVYTCEVCGASIVQTPGDAIDRQQQHIDWHDDQALGALQRDTRQGPQDPSG